MYAVKVHDFVAHEQSAKFHSFGMPPHDFVDQRLDGTHSEGALAMTEKHVRNDWIDSVIARIQVFKHSFYHKIISMRNEIISKVRADIRRIISHSSKQGESRCVVFSAFPHSEKF